MAADLGFFRLPYSFPLDVAVRYKKCNFLTGCGNYATGEVLYNGAVVETTWFTYKSDFERIYKRALDFYEFLSDLSLDKLTREEYAYLCSDEYNFLSAFFLITKYDSKRLRTRSIERHLSPDEQSKLRGDNIYGTITGVHGQDYYLEHVEYDDNIININYRLQNRKLYSKSIAVKPYFAKCFWFGIKFNLLNSIIVKQNYWQLSQGAVNHWILPCFDEYDNEKTLQRLGYAKIL